MKYKLPLIGILLLLSFFALGCEKKGERNEANYKIYYIDRDENHISSLPYEPETSSENKEEFVRELLEQLTLPGEEIEYQPVISDFSVKSCNFGNGRVNLNLSQEYEMLKPAKEVLVRAAIVKTLTQVTGVEQVSIHVNGKNLVDTLGNKVGVMSADTFIDNTGEDMKKYEEVTLTLYFANETGDKLIKVNRTMRYNTNISLEKLVVEQLLYGPVDKKGKENPMVVFPTLNPETKIISVNIKDGICYVNFNNAILMPFSNVTADTVIYSLVNSLTELPGVLKVQLAVDGATEVTLGEKALSALFERNPDMLQKEETKKE